ncbi:helix-turn-helix transcriptional regulator [Actinomadura kijaniata]|uniref:Transcriptional regulator with XRE-family HTH domain n=1 Tax=Actinomadura namibiensis TaxID=182080 RepID=A0A7W3LQ01_ACTNM|nr:helix-turn-helix transcriptional regulator [Actinomadura namibiensis]MBA8952175.1 transcriptional regulator with XRE-family HTH domain [Actinomadura namibiensis]
MPVSKIPAELLTFGAEVKRLRLAKGLTQAETADTVNVTRGYVGQVEAGTTRCRADFARRLDHALSAEGRLIEAWEELLDNIKKNKYPKFFLSFPKAEHTATMLRGYEERLVYGLFQTEGYARALLSDEEAVKARMRRQEILQRDPPPTVSVVMDVSVLYRELGGPDVMRDQLHHLLDLSQHSNINVQVLPTIHVRNLWGTFAIATLGDNSQVVYTDKAYGGETSTAVDDVAFVSEVFSTLQAEAHNARETRALIRKVIDERWS